MEEQKPKNKIVGTVIGLAVVAIVSVLLKLFVFNAPAFDKAILKAVSELNKSCPIMVDQQTRLDNAIALPGKVLQYNYTLVNWYKDSIDVQAFEQYMKPVLINLVKTSPNLKIYRDHNATLSYSYKDKNGVFVDLIPITPDLYKEKK